jgi:hypothetical protein
LDISLGAFFCLGAHFSVFGRIFLSLGAFFCLWAHCFLKKYHSKLFFL